MKNGNKAEGQQKHLVALTVQSQCICGKSSVDVCGSECML